MSDTNPVEAYFNRLAPSWDADENSTAEERRELLGFLPLANSKRILDIGCGTGVITGDLLQLSGGDVTAVDLSPKMIEIAKKKYGGQKNIEFIAGDFLTLKLKHYDLAVIYNAYPHFSDPEALSESLNGALSKNGYFAIIHSMSRDRLVRHHQNVPSNVSRNLKSPAKEAYYFEKHFKLVSFRDDDKFWMLFQKR